MFSKRNIIIGLFIITSIGLGFSFPFFGYSNINKPVVYVEATYPAFELEELADQATIVIHGIVNKKGKTEIVKIPVTTEIDKDDSNKGKFLENIETEVIIEVRDSIKNKDEKKYVIYREEGGELEDHIIEPAGGSLKIGEEVLIFLNSDGYSWGEQSVLRVKENKVTVFEGKEKKSYNVEEVKTKLKNHLKNKN